MIYNTINNKADVQSQINARQNGLAPSQLNRQKIPIWGVGLTEGQAPTSKTHPLTWRLYHQDAVLSLADYQRLEGFVGLKNALALDPKEVGEMIKNANVRGRGGAGFNAGLKWTFMTPPDGGVRYLICNADEMEPGTFKDRLLMECIPFQLIEGMLITAYAIGASVGYIFIRGEYILAAERLQAAIDECLANNLLCDRLTMSWVSSTTIIRHVPRRLPAFIIGSKSITRSRCSSLAVKKSVLAPPR